MPFILGVVQFVQHLVALAIYLQACVAKVEEVQYMQHTAKEQEAFIQKCVQIAQEKRADNRTDTALLTLLHELVEKIGNLLEHSEKKEHYPMLPTGSTTGAIPYAERTVFDAIPINKENIGILCTPVYHSLRWKIENTSQYILDDVCDAIENIQNLCVVENTANTWEYLEEYDKKKR